MYLLLLLLKEMMLLKTLYLLLASIGRAAECSHLVREQKLLRGRAAPSRLRLLLLLASAAGVSLGSLAGAGRVFSLRRSPFRLAGLRSHHDLRKGYCSKPEFMLLSQ
jgi:hypothetical protein